GRDRVPGPGDIASGTDLLADSLRPGTPGTEPVLPGECDPLTPQEWGSHPSAHDPLQDADPGPRDPVKFSAPHVPVGFGPGGLLVLAVPRGGRPELVELHSMEVILYDSEEQEEMRIFSGPLNRDDVYKVDIVTFCQRKAEQSCRAQSPRGQDSALLWKLLVLLCRQNGSMVGSDVADLLMKDCGERGQDQRQPPVADLIGLDGAGAWPMPSPGTPNLLTGETPPSVETPAQVVEKFTKLLYFGRKKEALEYAMKNHLWGHALFLSSKMDSRTYNWVMSGFISTLALNDPLQTFFQLMSGRIPQAATSCGDQQWGDWRPHLAMVLSNQGAEPELQRRTIVTLGDTLASKGLVEAAHFCYLMAQVPFGHYPVKTDRLVLLGSSHSQAFPKFATTEAIQRTETLEYCQTLGRPQASIPSFQAYKLLYAARLADHGLASRALRYCEAVGAALLARGGAAHPVLAAELVRLAERLKFSDPLDADPEPEWLVQLRRRQGALQLPSTCSPRVFARYKEFHLIFHRQRERETLRTLVQFIQLFRELEEPMQAARQMSRPPLGLSGAHSADDGGAAPAVVPVPLYPVAPAALPGRGGSGAGPEAPLPPAGDPGPAPEPFLPLDGVEVTPGPQVTPVPRVPVSPASSAKKEQEVEEKEEEEESPAAREKQENSKGSGFGWFSWFRSKPSSSSSSGDEDPSDSEDAPRPSHPPRADPGPALMPSSAFQPLSGAADGLRAGGLPGPAASPSDFNPGFLLPPPTFQVPLYNPAQVPQLSTVSSQNRPNRLAQRRYPAQPAVL
ncbi:protein transport protein Sec16B-like, partial [Sorex fumeus]|uniref:protein transport protein Sec16B-like n=1 Tax=Sorex fumeus TaxID=62283 RepID=UPI0024ADF2A8